MKRLLALTVLWSLGAWAQPSPEMLTAKMPVSDQSTSTVQKALPEAFKQVIAQVTDNPNPDLTRAPGNLANLVQNYTFVRESNAQGQSQLMLQITFDATAVQDFLKTNGQKVAQISTDSSQAVNLQVDGINNLQDYIDVMAALKNIQLVKKVSVEETRDSTLVLVLELNGEMQNFQGILSQNKNFLLENTNASSLAYRWTRIS